MTSIRRRLLILLLSVWILVWFAVALITLERSSHEITELFDAQLTQTARVLREITLANRLPPKASDGITTAADLDHPYQKKVSFQLWRDGELMGAFGGAPRDPLAHKLGFSDRSIGDTNWRVFGLNTGRPGEVLYVGESYAIRRELVRYLTIDALKPTMWALPLTIILIWLAVTSALAPLRRLTRAIHGRSGDKLAPIDIRTTPEEVRPLTNALNGLLERLDLALAAERRFTADAAHELRTPLTVIRTHAQVARQSQDPTERDRALEHLIGGVDRTAHLVSQLLMLARLEPEAQGLTLDTCSLRKAVEFVLIEQQPAAAAKSVTLAARFPDDPCLVQGDYPALTVLVGNLVDNAIKYSPAGGRVEIALARLGDEVGLRVEDTGPGIPSGERERALERFYRRPGQPVPGAGLGLSIVYRICALHSARLQLGAGTEGRGLRADVLIPTATTDLSATGGEVNPNREIPRLCRGDSRSLTFAGVHRGNSKS